jgi:GNAT superfamily N-acetyltransferase
MLRAGFGGPGPYTLRLARPDEGPSVARLIGLAGLDTEDGMLRALEQDVQGALTLATLESDDDGLAALAQHMKGGQGVMGAFAARTTILVATHPDQGEPVGVCLSNPSGTALGALAEHNAPLLTLMLIMLSVTKIPALAVDPAHRGAGLGRALLLQSTALAHQVGASLVYGSIRTADNLVSWYEGCGFSVYPEKAGLDLSHLVDRRVGVLPGPAERLFVSDSRHPAQPGRA